jgi:hypothetical protein
MWGLSSLSGGVLMVWKYWKQVARSAWVETIKSLHLNSLVGFMIWVASTLVVLAGLSFWGSADSSRDELLTRLFIGSVALGAIPFVFTLKMIGEPPRSYWQLRQWAVELEKAILESRESDAALMALAERQQNGNALVRKMASIEELLAWEKDLDQFIKENFDVQLFLSVCGSDHAVVTYSSTFVGSDKISETRNVSEEQPDLSRIDAKLIKLANLLPYAGMNYRGKTINTIGSMVTSIQLYGLPEHRLPLSTE